MEKLKKVVLTSAIVWFSTLVIYNSFGNEEHLDLNSAKSIDIWTWETDKKYIENWFIKYFLKSDLTDEEFKDAIESTSYFNSLVKKNIHNSDNLYQIKNTFLEHIEKYIDESKMKEFTLFIDQSYSSSHNEKFAYDKFDTSSWWLKKDELSYTLPSKDILLKAKKEINEKYSELINNIPEEKLPKILDNINSKLSKLKKSSIKSEKKEKYLIILTALSEIIDEKVNFSLNGISIEELLK